MKIIERTKGHYEVQDMEFGKVYKWHPELVVVECDCGKRSTHKRTTLLGSVITCECGEDHTAGVREELVVQLLEEDEAAHPWRRWHSSESSGIPF